MNIRTDLAMEAVELYCKDEKKDFDGIEITTSKKGDVTVSVMNVKNETAEKKINRKKGTYLTVEFPAEFFTRNINAEEELSEIVAECLGLLTGDTKGKCVLVVGLGNRAITADSIGPAATDMILVTRHIKELIGSELAYVCASTPGVMGITGMETGEIVSGIVKNVNPDMVICIDALAAKSIERVGTTIQMCNTGIAPGAGVGNNRKALDCELLGVPVYVIGVPTVVDAYSLVCDITGEENFKTVGEKCENFSVAPKDVDFLCEQMAEVISRGINIALVGEGK